LKLKVLQLLQLLKSLLILLFLYKKFGTKQVKFSWLGGEDKSSLVLGMGRPFFAKIVNPKIRRARLGKNIPLDNITICNAKIISQIPKEPIHFRSQDKMSISTINEIQPGDLKILQTLKQNPVLVSEKFGKHSKKTVYAVKYKKSSSNSFSLFLHVDGGFPFKKFIESIDVNPNLSGLLGNQCRCKEFDFYEIELK